MVDEQARVSTPSNVIQELRRDRDFISRYANNIQLEGSAFDLKLIFGLLDQSGVARGGSLAVDQHTSISLSWPEAKLLIFFLRLHVAGHEKENGKIKIPIGALPAEPPATPPPPFDNPQGRVAFDLIRKLRAELIAEEKD